MSGIIGLVAWVLPADPCPVDAVNARPNMARAIIELLAAPMMRAPVISADCGGDVRDKALKLNFWDRVQILIEPR